MAASVPPFSSSFEEVVSVWEEGVSGRAKRRQGRATCASNMTLPAVPVSAAAVAVHCKSPGVSVISVEPTSQP